jgi:hypothetical protein
MIPCSTTAASSKTTKPLRKRFLSMRIDVVIMGVLAAEVAEIILGVAIVFGSHGERA